MEASPTVAAVRFLTLYELQQTGERTLLVHHVERDLILTAVEEEEGNDQVQSIGIIFLFQSPKGPSAINTSKLGMGGRGREVANKREQELNCARHTWSRPYMICLRT